MTQKKPILEYAIRDAWEPSADQMGAAIAIIVLAIVLSVVLAINLIRH